MSEPIEPGVARLLADPTRARILAHVLEAPGPVTVAELTDLCGCTHNAVRQHLRKLKDGGLVDEEVEARDRPGRPRLQYRPGPEAAGMGPGPSPSERLSILLLDMLRTGRDAREAGRIAGREEAEAARMRGGSGGLELLEAVARHEGFNPVRRDHAGHVDLVLQRCPFSAAATVDPQTVCTLHLGLAEGVAAESGISIRDLVANDPQGAGCHLEVVEGAGSPETDRSGGSDPRPEHRR
ncbi:MAG: helix-turn-helix domain-containing protein [Acidimicrobiia bacterium]|nr:helix-turn-helix domain-containing protein [Acidimicrobiia bacterium]